jgi:hypothetical protein
MQGKRVALSPGFRRPTWQLSPPRSLAGRSAYPDLVIVVTVGGCVSRALLRRVASRCRFAPPLTRKHQPHARWGSGRAGRTGYGGGAFCWPPCVGLRQLGWMVGPGGPLRVGLRRLGWMVGLGGPWQLGSAAWVDGGVWAVPGGLGSAAWTDGRPERSLAGLGSVACVLAGLLVRGLPGPLLFRLGCRVRLLLAL